MKKISKIIYAHFQIHWKLILIFFIFWITLIAILFDMSFSNEFFVIGDGEPKNIVKYNDRFTVIFIEVMVIDRLYTFIFNGFGIVFYLFVIIIILNKIIIGEVNSNQISLWLTQPISKNKVILAKYFFLLLSLSMFYLPSYLIMLSVSAQALDRKTLYSNLALGGLQTYIYLLFLATVFFALSLFLAENGNTANIIFSSLIVYLFLITILEILTLFIQIENKFVLFFIDYGGPQALLTQVFNYDLDAETEILIVPGGSENGWYEFTPIKVVSVNYIKFWILFVIMGASTVGLVFLNCYIFRNKSLNI